MGNYCPKNHDFSRKEKRCTAYPACAIVVISIDIARLGNRSTMTMLALFPPFGFGKTNHKICGISIHHPYGISSRLKRRKGFYVVGMQQFM